MIKSPAIFLDRDGTIIDDVGFIKNPQDIIVFPESFKALKLLQEHFILFIISNQSGISKGITTEEEVIAVNNHLIAILKTENIVIRDIFVCPHVSEDNCRCRKPSPFFINKAAEMYNLDIPGSYIIGDHPSDAMCGINAGAEPVFILTGHGKHHLDEIPEGVKVCENILDAANFILSKKV